MVTLPVSRTRRAPVDPAPYDGRGLLTASVKRTGSTDVERAEARWLRLDPKGRGLRDELHHDGRGTGR